MLLTATPAVPATDPGAPPSAGAPSAEEAPNDARLQQKVTVQASSQKLSDLLAWLTKTTGVTLVPRLEVAEEQVTLWAQDRSLIEVMRDLRHLYRLYWSRSKRGGEWVYSVWQDAQSKAREEAEVQRWALEKQREFEQSIRQRVRALSASDEELKRLGVAEPYLVVQMKHPVVRNGYRLFATLSPDRQAQLTQSRTPGRPLSYGDDLHVFPHQSLPEDKYTNSDDWSDHWQPRGDVVRLTWEEMTAPQRAIVQAILRGAARRLQEEADQERERHPDHPNHAEAAEIQSRAAAAGDPTTATASLFRWGDPNSQGLSLRVDFRSGGRPWAIYSNIGLPESRSYDETLRKGERMVPGVSREAERLLAEMQKAEVWRTPPPAPPVFDPKPDPILDAPLSFTWTLPLRDFFSKREYSLVGGEVMAALHRSIGRPLVVAGLPTWLQQPRNMGDRFRWEKRPLRELLTRFFPGYRGHVHEGAIFLEHPERLRWRLHELPRAVEQFLEEHKGPYSLDDMALLARSLSPWQIVKLRPHLPNAAIDELLAAQELLKLYGDLSPEQRTALAQGLTFPALTPPQQALFLRFAQQTRPFVEPWRFQQGSLQLAVGPSPIRDDGRGGPATNVLRALFQVRFAEADAQTFPVDLFPATGRKGWQKPVSLFVGQPFPGFWKNNRVRSAGDEPFWEPALNDPRLQNRPFVAVIARPYAEPYAGTTPPPTTIAWTRELADRLRPAGVTVAHLTVGPREAPAAPSAASRAPNLLLLWDPGDINGHPFDSAGSGQEVPQSPTVFLVDRTGIVRAVFEGMAAWDAEAVERAARALH